MTIRLFLAVSIMLASTAAVAGDYWPHQEGAIYTYINDSGEVLDVAYGSFGTRESVYATGGFGQGYQVTEYFREDVDGDIYLQKVQGYFIGAIDPEYWGNLGENFIFLDLPLVVGKEWVSYIQTSCCYGPCPVGLAATVVGPAEVTVPLGTYSVVEVSFLNITPSCATDIPTGTMMLNREVGPVALPGGYELVAISGVVSVETQTWGAVKSLYR
jgi:hypothetical protein